MIAAVIAVFASPALPDDDCGITIGWDEQSQTVFAGFKYCPDPIILDVESQSLTLPPDYWRDWSTPSNWGWGEYARQVALFTYENSKIRTLTSTLLEPDGPNQGPTQRNLSVNVNIYAEELKDLGVPSEIVDRYPGGIGVGVTIPFQYNVRITSPYQFEMDMSAHLRTLVLEPGAKLRFSTPVTLSVDFSFDNAGTVLLNSPATIRGTGATVNLGDISGIGAIETTELLNASGAILTAGSTASGPDGTLRISSSFVNQGTATTTGSSTLRLDGATQNFKNLIASQDGQILINSGFDNEIGAATKADGGLVRIVNSDSSFENVGDLISVNGGLLEVNGSSHNAGSINVSGTGSRGVLYGLTNEDGGTITARDGGDMRIAGLTNHGSLQVSDAGTMRLSGASTSSTQISVEAGGQLQIYGTLDVTSLATSPLAPSVHVSGGSFQTLAPSDNGKTSVSTDGSILVDAGGTLDLTANTGRHYVGSGFYRIGHGRSEVIASGGIRIGTDSGLISSDLSPTYVARDANEITGTVANEGTVEITHGLNITGDVTNSGPSAKIRVAKDLSILGTFENSALVTIENSADLRIEGGALSSNTGQIELSNGSLTLISNLRNSGSISLTNSEIGGAGILFNQNRIHGDGRLSVGIANQMGAGIDAGPGETLSFEGTNQASAGTVQAWGGGKLQFAGQFTNLGETLVTGGSLADVRTGSTFINDGSIVVRDAGSTFQLLGSTTGVPVRVQGTGSVELLDGATLDLTASRGVYYVGGGAYKSRYGWSILENDVTIDSSSQLISRDVTTDASALYANQVHGEVSNSGSIEVQHDLEIYGSVHNHLGTSRIEVSSGQVLLIDGGLVNDSDISVGSGAQLHVTGPLQSNANISLDGGTLRSDGEFLNQSSVLMSSATVSGTGRMQNSLRIAGNGTISIAELQNDTGATIEAQGGGALVFSGEDHVNSGLVSTAGGTNVTFSGGFTNSGEIRVAAGSLADVRTGSTFINDGSIVVRDAGSTFQLLGSTTGVPVRVQGTGSVELLDGATLDLTASRGVYYVGGGSYRSRYGWSIIENDVTIDSSSLLISRDLTTDASAYYANELHGEVANAGLIDVSHDLEIDGTLRNEGTVVVRDRARFSVQSAEVENYSNSTLTGGTWDVRENSTLDMAGANITTNRADIRLSGTGSTFNAVNGLIDNEGTFSISEGRDFTTVGDWTNSGTLFVGAGSSFTVGGTGSLYNSGSIFGEGLIDANLYSAGLISPGSSPGSLFIDGNFSQDPLGVLLFELAGPEAGLFDFMGIAGSVHVEGALSISLLNEYLPVDGQMFTLMSFSSWSGEFSTVNGLQFTGGYFDLVYGDDYLSLVTHRVAESEPVPEPGTWILVLLGLSIAAARWNRKRRPAKTVAAGR